MFVAQKLRAQNITGYVIYMFQVEDVIRAYALDIDRICQEYLPRFQFSDDQLRIIEWAPCSNQTSSFFFTVTES